MREIRHDNLVPFLGACVFNGGDEGGGGPGEGGGGGGGGGGEKDGEGGGGELGGGGGIGGGGLYVVTPFCGRGGLDDVLSNENYRLVSGLVSPLKTLNIFHF